jgi:hypothetical protein
MRGLERDWPPWSRVVVGFLLSPPSGLVLLPIPVLLGELGRGVLDASDLLLYSTVSYVFTLFFLLPLYFVFNAFRVRNPLAFVVGGGIAVWLLAAVMFLALIGVELALHDDYTIQHQDELEDEAVAKSLWFLPIGALSGLTFWTILFSGRSRYRNAKVGQVFD